MRPRILEARRRDPSTFSAGDEAVAEFGPGLLRFLTLREAGGIEVGEGGQFPWTIPVGAAGTAAYAAMEPAGFEGVNNWTGVTNRVRYLRPCRPDETLIASCRLAALGRAATTPYRVYSRERGDLLVEGEFVFVSVVRDAQGWYVIDPRRRPDAPVSPRGASEAQDRRVCPPAPALIAQDKDEEEAGAWDHLPLWTASAPASREAGEAPQAPLFLLRPPRVLRSSAPASTPGAVWEWLFPCDLLRLLGHPIAGAAEPLGRRHHPYGRILEGMGVHAALAIAGGGVPDTLEVEWWSPTTGNADFRIRSTLRSRSAARTETAHDVYEGERAVGAVRVTVVNR